VVSVKADALSSPAYKLANSLWVEGAKRPAELTIPAQTGAATLVPDTVPVGVGIDPYPSRMITKRETAILFTSGARNELA
jgi:hypothetical protein